MPANTAQTITTHNLGYPRIGDKRQLKFALEQYWSNQSNENLSNLENVSQTIRAENWATQSKLTLAPVGDFSHYDQILDTSILLGNIPKRFKGAELSSRDLYFYLARGKAPNGLTTSACEMTKWFDTNYHYLVPEFSQDTQFELNPSKLLKEIDEAKSLGINVKPTIVGPITYLWLGKAKDNRVNKLDLLESLILVYGQLLEQLADAGIEWVQIDEPVLSFDLPQDWKAAFESTYHKLHNRRIKTLLASYFGPLNENLGLLTRLPVEGIHLDAVRGRADINKAVDLLSSYKVISLGVIDGRNIWKSDLNGLVQWLQPIYKKLGDRLWLAPSCSLLHSPIDLDQEQKIETSIKNWLAFSKQKLEELNTLAIALAQGEDAVKDLLADNFQANTQRKNSDLVNNSKVKKALNNIDSSYSQRHSTFAKRAIAQQEFHQLPKFPTTTIGSFPQTSDIRSCRRLYKNDEIDFTEYQSKIFAHIKEAIDIQINIGLDVLVHGEAERNDMVEYFGEQLEGYAFTQLGWVQSYGSRCVKPPIIYGDVHRPHAMTLDWSVYAQQQTDKPVKGMLTGPITMLQWAFVRDDQPREITAKQIALAIREEVCDLEKAGIKIIQVDEPAVREGLPLRKSDWAAYLKWAVETFKISTCGVEDTTQIHTHMCYSEFNDIIESIAALDADVITIETSRSDMVLLDAFADFEYPNEIGPGVYDIHSPNLPKNSDIKQLLEKAAQRIPCERLWINPDCGLKTRTWDEVIPALESMVSVARELRKELREEKTQEVA